MASKKRKAKLAAEESTGEPLPPFPFELSEAEERALTAPEEVGAALREDASEPPALAPVPESASTPLEQKKLAEKTAAPSKKATGQSMVQFSTFLNICGLKPDQRAGFKLWARHEKEDKIRRTVADWKLLLEKFQNTPLRGAVPQPRRR